MTNFVKRSLLRVIILTICTLGIYSLYWGVATKRELEKAGGNLPNAILIFIPFINLYFWYRYAQAYTKIVKKNQDATEVNLNFLVAILPQISRFFTGHYSHNTNYVITQQNGDQLIHSAKIGTEVKSTVIKSTFAKTALITTLFSTFFLFFLLVVLAVFSLVIFKIYYFQDGYNEYQN